MSNNHTQGHVSKKPTQLIHSLYIINQIPRM